MPKRVRKTSPKVGLKNKIKTKHFQDIGRFWIIWLLPFLILESFLFSEVIENYNYLELFPSETIFPTVMHAVTAFLIALTVFYAKRPNLLPSKMLSAVLLGLFMVNYQERLSQFSGITNALIPLAPKGNGQVILSDIVFLAVLIFVSLFLGSLLDKFVRKRGESLSGNLTYGIIIFVGVIFLSQAITVSKIFAQTIPQSKVVPPAIKKPDNSLQVSKDKPDIYYIVLDRYTNQEVLKNQFNFDNSSFTDYLKEAGFFVNPSAKSNYPYTTMSVASTLNANYTKDLTLPFVNDDIQSRVLYHNTIRQSSVAKSLKDEGYQYVALGSWYEASNKNPLANADLTYSLAITNRSSGRDIKRLRGIEGFQFKKSPYYQLIQSVSWLPIGLNEYSDADMVRNQLNQLTSIADDQPGGRFVFAHILVPHDPFTFNADGSISDYAGTDNIGKPIKQKYVDQVQFINTQIKSIVDKINENSNNQAVILLNSDEGPYPMTLNSTFLKPMSPEQAAPEILHGKAMSDWSQDWLEMKYGILQAVHIPKATQDDLQKLSSVNLFRIVLNKYFGYNLPYLDNCNFGLTAGTAKNFSYSDITPKLQDSPSPECKDNKTTGD